ncbi:MAG: VanZ family protein [Acidobacteriota bacterium]
MGPGTRRLLLCIWWLDLAFVAATSLLPGRLLMRIGLGPAAVNDKGVHFLAYASLAVLPVLGIARPRCALAAAASVVLLGLALEFAQRLVPGRSFEWADFAANNLGVLAGAAAGLLVRRLAAAGPAPSQSQ